MKEDNQEDREFLKQLANNHKASNQEESSIEEELTRNNPQLLINNQAIAFNDLSPEQKNRLLKYAQDRKKIEQLKVSFYSFMTSFKEGQENKFTLVDATLEKVYMVFQMWNMRNKRSAQYVMILELEGQFQSDVDKLMNSQILKMYPSITVVLNGNPIQIEGKIVRTQGDYYYEGTQELMTIISEVRRSRYLGPACNFQPHGTLGQLVVYDPKNSYLYRGQFHHGKQHGKGHFRLKNSIYQGQFKDDYKDGEGHEVIFKNRKKKPDQSQKSVNEKQPPKVKSQYTGTFKQGYRDGKGIEITSQGTYDGQWSDNCRSGKGKMIYKKGDTYDGDWLNNQFHGQGVYTEKDGAIYEGQFKNGKYHGKGKMTYANGDVYEGDYEDGKKHGEGKYQWSDGDYYDGFWKEDSAEGQGTSMVGSDYFVGEFKNGKKHGEGELTNEDGDITHGIWENNVLFKILQINGEPPQEES